MRALAALMIASCLACGEHLDVFEFSDAGLPDATATATVADILFVVDNSGSMAEEQENLARSFVRFADGTIGRDLQIGVITTDLLSANGERAGRQLFAFSSTYPYILTNFSGSDCVDLDIAHGCFRGPDPARRMITSRLSRDEQIEAFAENVRVGTCGSGTERGLEAMLAALAQTGPGGCNEGFLRPHANLVIVLISDEQDQKNRPVVEIVDELVQYKPVEQIRVATIVGSIMGVPVNCRIGSEFLCGSICDSPPPQGSGAECTRNQDCTATEDCVSNRCQNAALQYWASCHSCSFYNAPDCCEAQAGSRYIEFARMVEQRVHAASPAFAIDNCIGSGGPSVCLTEPICQESFGDTLARIASELIVSD
jgi:hypothetical protein